MVASRGLRKVPKVSGRCYDGKCTMSHSMVPRVSGISAKGLGMYHESQNGAKHLRYDPKALCTIQIHITRPCTELSSYYNNVYNPFTDSLNYTYPTL